MFAYDQAFSRNIGWVTEAEQARLRTTRIAIAGMGGVGGTHLLTLVRLGVTRFRIADFDCFDIVNFNRQAGASMSTLGQSKARVMAQMARDINPDIVINVFEDGVNAANLSQFLDGVDVYVDGLDFFAFEARAQTFALCRSLRIPAVTAAPLGMGAAVLNFMPDGMDFESYFGWNGRSDTEKAMRFMIGLAPRLLQDYVADSSKVNLQQRRGPSTVMACQMCAGMAAAEVLKIILRRGNVLAAPRGVHFDAYRNKMVKTWRPGGHRNPLQQLLLAVVRRRLASLERQAASRS